MRILIPGQSWLTPLGRIPIQRPFTVVGFLSDRLAAMKKAVLFISMMQGVSCVYLKTRSRIFGFGLIDPFTQIIPLRAAD